MKRPWAAQQEPVPAWEEARVAEVVEPEMAACF